jgi:hypothetical protein
VRFYDTDKKARLTLKVGPVGRGERGTAPLARPVTYIHVGFVVGTAPLAHPVTWVYVLACCRMW